METITFYSYKGGVGRTLALASVSLYLSRFEQDICLVDFDLEAPGLHYKFPNYLTSKDVKLGLVDYIYEFTQNKTIPKSLQRYSLLIKPKTEDRGEIRLIPAGNALSADYWKKLASINWHNLFYEDGSEGIPFFIELKERIKKEFNPNFLFIDSRTGITEMSGICTSLLPDKVVFLIINNQENIEGAKQILRAIQKVERLRGQKPIDIAFVLSRIPYVESDEARLSEANLLDKIKSTLNKSVEDLEIQLDIKDIYVLHSDRKLEFSETIVLEEIKFKEEPILKDYLRLFSKIIPEDIIVQKIESVLEVINEKIWDDPDKTQNDLEELAEIYAHQKSYETLIKFYILRKEDLIKILKTFEKLFRTFGYNNFEMLSRYIDIFKKFDISDLNYYRRKDGKLFDPEVIEKYLKLIPEKNIEIELKLSDLYNNLDKYEKAIEHYLKIIDDFEDRKNQETVLQKLLNTMIKHNQFKESLKFLEDYSEIIERNLELKVLKLRVFFNLDRKSKIETLISDTELESFLLDNYTIFYIKTLEKLGQSRLAYIKLTSILKNAINKRDDAKIHCIGSVYYRLGKKDEFKHEIGRRVPAAKKIIRKLEEIYEDHLINP